MVGVCGRQVEQLNDGLVFVSNHVKGQIPVDIDLRFLLVSDLFINGGIMPEHVRLVCMVVFSRLLCFVRKTTVFGQGRYIHFVVCKAPHQAK